MQEITKRIINVVAVLLISLFMLWTINTFLKFEEINIGGGSGFITVFKIVFITIIILANVFNIFKLVKAIIDYRS